MNTPPRVGLQTSTRKLPPSEGMGNTVTVVFANVTEQIHEDPATGIQTLLKSNSSSFSINFSIGSTCHRHIRDLILDRLMNGSSSISNERFASESSAVAWFFEVLASLIASTASNLGFGTNGFEITMVLTFTDQRVSVVSSLLHKLVFKGIINGEELKRLKMETEPCSICLRDLSGAGFPTRMPCSHVFHVRCLLEWFSRKNTCPMCRRVLFHMKQRREG